VLAGRDAGTAEDYFDGVAGTDPAGLVGDPLPENEVPPVAPLPLGRAAQDLELWHRWRRDPGDHTLAPLMKQIHPVVQNEVNRWRGVLAEPLLYGRAQVLARKSLDTYDPNRGTQLATHVTNGLRKLSRLTYTNQNVARLSENKTLKFNTFRQARERLEDALGRPATVDELADELCWTPSAVTQFRAQTSRQELLEGGGHGDPEAVPSEQRSADDYLVDFVHHDLPQQQKVIFEHLTGYGGAPKLTPAQVAKRLGLSSAQLAYQKRLITDRVRRAQEGR
jgi:DNA-directed RNA polymerase specialized sigma subunit